MKFFNLSIKQFITNIFTILFFFVSLLQINIVYAGSNLKRNIYIYENWDSEKKKYYYTKLLGSAYKVDPQSLKHIVQYFVVWENDEGIIKKSDRIFLGTTIRKFVFQKDGMLDRAVYYNGSRITHTIFFKKNMLHKKEYYDSQEGGLYMKVYYKCKEGQIRQTRLIEYRLEKVFRITYFYKNGLPKLTVHKFNNFKHYYDKKGKLVKTVPIAQD